MKSVVPQIEEPTPRGIAAAISRMITSGDLAPGDRLPTVRELAADLGVSPATVSHAWQTLAAAGLIASRGRSGSFVRSAPREWMPRRYQGMDGAEARLDLSRGTPDPELLPSLGPVLARIAASVESVKADSHKYMQKPDIPQLHDLMRETWPSPVESLTVVNGALDAIDRVLATLVRYGDRVAVETPGFPPLLDLLDQYGLEPVGIELDADGAVPSSFVRALARQPAVILLQPRAHNPTGVSMTAERAQELAGLLRRSRVADQAIVIEDDHSGSISSAPDVSLARWLPDRVLHIRSFSKSHGPDLRIGALGGPRGLVDRVVARRLLGPGWTSRMTQALLFDLLTHPDSVAEVSSARLSYSARQSTFAAALGRLGVRQPVGDGINAWVRVADERAATVSLAAAGIRVAPGAPFQLGDGAPHVRVTVGMLRDDVDAVAAALVTASRA